VSSKGPPSRGEVWQVDLSPTRGHEQAGRRPALVVSTDRYNHGPAGLVVIVPMTTRERRIPLWVRVERPEGGVKATSFIQTDAIRSVSRERLSRRWGTISETTMAAVDDRLRILLEL
jgi:mRNA interferase MazF